jgi:hypothetical protein
MSRPTWTNLSIFSAATALPPDAGSKEALLQGRATDKSAQLTYLHLFRRRLGDSGPQITIG